VVVGRRVGREGEELVTTTLGDLDPDSIDMTCLLIIGSSQTVATPSGVWTSRSHP
jgi:precorrin-2 C20-methyltransferase/precorrin-3B C17-methyltransferase